MSLLPERGQLYKGVCPSCFIAHDKAAMRLCIHFYLYYLRDDSFMSVYVSLLSLLSVEHSYVSVCLPLSLLP